MLGGARLLLEAFYTNKGRKFFPVPGSDSGRNGHTLPILIMIIMSLL